MVQKVTLKIIAITVVLLLSLATVQVATASESTTAAAATPDITVILGTTGHQVGGATVSIDGTDVGKTDTKGNLTLKEPLTGSHTVKVTMKGINDTTVTADFSSKPVVVKTSPAKGTKTLTMHVTDKNTKAAVAGVDVVNNHYKIGTTDANGDLVIDGFPQGLYLLNLEKNGYKKGNTVMVFFSDKKPQNFTLTPA